MKPAMLFVLLRRTIPELRLLTLTTACVLGVRKRVLWVRYATLATVELTLLTVFCLQFAVMCRARLVLARFVPLRILLTVCWVFVEVPVFAGMTMYVMTVLLLLMTMVLAEADFELMFSMQRGLLVRVRVLLFALVTLCSALLNVPRCASSRFVSRCALLALTPSTGILSACEVLRHLKLQQL